MSSPTLALSQTSSTFCDFNIFMAQISNIDGNWSFSNEQEMREKYGPFRYFISPFMRKKKREVLLKVKYADRSDLYGVQEVCRADCRRCDHFHAPSADATSSLPTQKWKEKTILAPLEPFPPFILPNPLRYRYQPTFGVFPHFHTGDGIVQMTSLNFDFAFLLKWLLHDTGYDDFFLFIFHSMHFTFFTVCILQYLQALELSTKLRCR